MQINLSLTNKNKILAESIYYFSAVPDEVIEDYFDTMIAPVIEALVDKLKKEHEFDLESEQL